MNLTMNLTKVVALAGLIKEAKTITVLTGAGISTESGIPDFRSTNGLYKDEPRQNLMSIDFLRSKPKSFWPIYKEIFGIKMKNDFQPNYGHQFFADLEKQGKKVTIITQNVDGLHGAAGNSEIYEVHGSINHATCPKHKDIKYDLDYINSYDVPQCNHVNGKGHECKFVLHPGVVLFGDQIKNYDESLVAAVKCDLFIVVGSSLKVSPINELPVFARYGGSEKKLVLINNEETELDENFDIIIQDSIGSTLRKVDELMKR